MGCCCQGRTERPESREERLAALRHTIEDARRQLAELEHDEEEAA